MFISVHNLFEYDTAFNPLINLPSQAETTGQIAKHFIDDLKQMVSIAIKKNLT